VFDQIVGESDRELACLEGEMSRIEATNEASKVCIVVSREGGREEGITR